MKMFFLILILASALMTGCVIEGQSNNTDGNNNLWYKEKIVPDVLSYVPRTTSSMTFATGAVLVTAEYLSAQQMAGEIVTVDYSFDPTSLYTILMIDPDSPSAQNATDAQYVHWLIMNIEGGNFKYHFLHAGNIIKKYQNPQPQSNTGTHRYMVLIFIQSSHIYDRIDIGRKHFDVESFAQQYGLGKAVCGNFCLLKT